MSADAQFMSVQIYGSMELKTEYVLTDGAMVAYNYSIIYDREGNETSRTEPERGVELSWI